ncbi:hypothetical protein DFH11DRAFT_831246 [Phellopilus nigrolimitatus]|nr:hypothetical protein DFH11DRAFT_831246 [Phellopilus nigrolimitatus]
MHSSCFEMNNLCSQNSRSAHNDMASTTNALSFRTSHAIVAAEDYRGTSTGAGFDPQDPAHKTAIGVHLAPKVVAQKSGDIEVEDTLSQNSDFVLSSLRYKISLFLHHVLTRHCEESDFAWRVSSPVTTARYGNELAPPSILYASAIMPRRSSIEVIIGESFAYNVHIIATPLTCPTLVVTNHETGEPEYKPVLTVCAVVGNLYRAFNTRLPSAHWRTFSINQKLVLAKGLHTRRKMPIRTCSTTRCRCGTTT